MSSLRSLTDRLLEIPIVYRTWQAPFADAKLRPFLERTRGTPLRRVLDVGCGPGTNSSYFAQAEYVGVDINADYIATATKRFGRRFLLGDVADPAVLTSERFDCVFANSLMHHLDDDVTRRLLRAMSERVDNGGQVHILDLVLPSHRSMARLMARLDRGRFARPLDTWRALFQEALRERHFETYPLGVPGLPLWQMVYFVGVPR